MTERTNPSITSFKPMNLLRMGGEVVEALEHSPLYIHDVVSDNQDIILDQIEYLYHLDRMKAKNPENTKRTHIFIARLALRDEVSLRQIFTDTGRQNLHSIHTDPNHFSATPREYFEELRTTPFTPQIRIRGESGPEKLQGVWLSVQAKPNAQ